LAPKLDLLRLAEKLQLLTDTVEAMLDREHQAHRAPDLDVWTREVYRRVLAEAETVKVLRAGNRQVLEEVIGNWSAQPELIRALLDEIIGLLLSCRAQPGALEELADIIERIG
jgi:hypothetical protein